MTTLVAVADTGSFTGAADVLELPKSRVSQRITALEQELGVRLIHRTTRTIKFTEDGLNYLATCRTILQDVQDAEAALKDANLEPAGSLRIDALVLVARHVLAPRLHEFQSLYPKIHIKLTASERVSHLLEEGIDCVIRGGALDDSSAVAKQLAVVHLGLYAAPQYVALHGAMNHPEELSRHRLLSWFPSASNPFVWSLMTGDNICHVDAQANMIFDDPDVAIQACLAGGGICPSAPFAVQSLVRDGKLIPVLAQWHFAPRPIHVVYANRRHMTARMRAFITWLTKLAHSDSGLNLLPIELTQGLGQN